MIDGSSMLLAHGQKGQSDQEPYTRLKTVALVYLCSRFVDFFFSEEGVSFNIFLLTIYTSCGAGLIIFFNLLS